MDSSRAPAIHVVAAILRDARGRILLTRRTDGRDLAGLWEFPGGKVEPGESVEEALRRELREELGIVIGAIEPLIAVPHAYPHKRILLDVQRVATFSGRARGVEGQALAWVEPARLTSYPMPAADRPVVAALQQPAEYLVTPSQMPDSAAFLATLEAALRGGMRRVQLRLAPDGAPVVPRRALVDSVAQLTADAQAQLLLNGMLAGDLESTCALAHEFRTGLHLTSAQLHGVTGRPLPGEFIVAASCHTSDDLRRAEELGLDFAVLGPVAATPTHPEATPLGWARFAQLRETVGLPIYALGGLRRDDVATARRHGAQGIAAIRGLWSN